MPLVDAERATRRPQPQPGKRTEGNQMVSLAALGLAGTERRETDGFPP
jgi:hypothetical protein